MKKARKTPKTIGLIALGVALLVASGLRFYKQGYTNTLFSTQDTMNTTVKKGDLITVDYVGKLTDGTVFDTSIESIARESGKYMEQRDYTAGLSFTVGAGQMIAGFDAGVVGMQIGETKTVEIPADQAYGQKRDDMIVRVPLEQAGDTSGAVVGMKVVLSGMYPATITEITDTEIVFDANHELAGQDLIFDITIKSIDTPAS